MITTERSHVTRDIVTTMTIKSSDVKSTDNKKSKR